jgi:septum site-determining protein MinD
MIIAIVSAKGGVGKTTIVANVGTALATQFYTDTTLVDANMTAPNLNLYFGMFYFPKTLNAVLSGKYPAQDAVYRHPAGVKILPCELDFGKKFDEKAFRKSISSLDTPESIVMIDSPPTLGEEVATILQTADKAFAVMTPDPSSLLSTQMLEEAAEKVGISLEGLILNRVRYVPYELTEREVRREVGLPIIASIPEDPSVQKSLILHNPSVVLQPNAKSSIAFKKIAAKIVGKSYREPVPSLFSSVKSSLKNLILDSLVIFRRV